MKSWAYYVLGVLFGSLLGSVLFRCAYGSGEQAARRRYTESIRKTEDCVSAGGDRAACEAKFGAW